MKLMKNQHLLKVLLSVVLVGAVAVGGTLAYLTATANPILNTFALARVTTRVEEPTTGTAAEKRAGVANTGESPVYVRAMAVVSTTDGDVDTSAVSLNITNTQWVDGGDGYYYYTAILPARADDVSAYPTTSYLLDGVSISADPALSGKFSVDVYEESVFTGNETFELAAAKTAFDEKA